jgi:hypothetical protein
VKLWTLLKSETQEFRSIHGWWSTLESGGCFMDHEDELTKKIEEQFYGGRDEQIVLNTWKRLIIV